MRRRWLQAFVGSFLLLFCAGHGSIENTDATATMHAARALWLRGDSGLRGADQNPDWPGEAVLVAYIRAMAAAGTPSYGKQGKNGLTYVWFPIGHVWLMLPAVALGETLDRLLPSVEERFREKVAPGLAPAAAVWQNQQYRDGHFVLTQAVAAAMPALFGAVSLLLLFAIARSLGASRRDALWSAVAIGLGSQFFPLTNENLSDGPGLMFLLAALLATVRSVRGSASTLGMALGGLCAGMAVLSRYPHGTLVPLLALAIALAARHRSRWRDLWVFATAGLPCLIALLAIDWLRYGDVTDTGYPEADSWFNYPIWFGATKILFAAGKGVLWFSPLLWLVAPLAALRRIELRWLAWSLFLVPFVMFSATSGWQAGQCWGVRYVTPGITCLLALSLPQLRPWRNHRRIFLLLFAAGLFVNLTSVVAPTRGYGQLAAQAVTAYYQREHAEGRIGDEDWEHLDPADHFFFEPRYSALVVNWRYLSRSLRGDFEDEYERPRNGSRNTIEPLFGVVAVTPRQGTAPLYWEDRAGRHLWWGFWADLYGVSRWLLLLPVLAAGSLLAWRGFRGILHQP